MVSRWCWAVALAAIAGGSGFAADGGNASTLPAVEAASRPVVAPLPPATQAVVAPAPPAPKPPDPAFPLAEAATRSESAAITLRSIEAILYNDRATCSIQNDVPILTTEIDSRLDESASLLGASPSLQVLGEQEQDWSAIQQELVDWKHSLDRRHDQLKQASDEVAQLKLDWDKEQVVVNYWLGHAKSTDILKTGQASVDRTELAINRTSDDLHKTRVALFEVQQAVDGQAARVLGVLDSVDQARDEAFNRLLVRNSPPLWAAMQSSQEQNGLVEHGQQSFYRQVEAVDAYLKRRRENVSAQIVLLLALIAGLFWIRNRIRNRAAKQPELEQATRVFGSPIATAIVLALSVSAWIYPQAPRLLWAALGAAALIPTVIILRRLLARRWYSMLTALVVFYFLDQLRSVAAIVPVVARLLLLVQMLGGFLLLISFIQSARSIPVITRVAKLLRFARWLWLVVFALAFLGDLLGYVSLANVLGDAGLGSLYLAVILYACTVILSGLIVIALHSRPLCLLRMVRQHQPLILHRLILILTWMAVGTWVLGVMASLSVAGVAYELVKRILSAQLAYAQIRVSLGNVLAFVLAIWASVLISRFIRFVLEEDIYDRFALSGGITYAVSKMLNYVILLIGFFIAVSSLGYDMTQFTILAGAFGVGLGFGMQNIVNNFVSGLILLFERPVKVGDVIQMDTTTGVVGHIGIRASIIRTRDSAEIIVPNGNMISSTVTNWTLSNRQRGIEITIAAGAAADPRHVLELLTRVAAEHPLIVKIPAPEAFLNSFAADSFSYLLRAWTNDAERWIEIRSDLSVAIHAALTKENIPIR